MLLLTLTLALALVPLATAAAAAWAGSASPNVLMIAIDDMRPSLGSYGAPVLTPHMDKLASESLLFDRAFANFPWCNPSRNSLLSGRRPDTNKVWNFNVDLRTTWQRPNGPKNGTNASYVTLPQHFLENGCETSGCPQGCPHHAALALSQPASQRDD
jgi:iduronate 2-sulfatase